MLPFLKCIERIRIGTILCNPVKVTGKRILQGIFRF